MGLYGPYGVLSVGLMTERVATRRVAESASVPAFQNGSNISSFSLLKLLVQKPFAAAESLLKFRRNEIAGCSGRPSLVNERLIRIRDAAAVFRMPDLHPCSCRVLERPCQ